MDETIYSRRLQPEDWEQFRDIKLHALKNNATCFGSTYEKERDYSAEDWQQTLSDERHAVFGLFDGLDMIGLSACFTWWNDDSGKTAVLVMWYLKEPYRGKGLFVPLVQKTIDWAEGEKRFDRIIVAHRDGNESSRKSNQKLGFRFTHTESNTWPDGVTADQYFYERRIVP